MNLLSVIVHEMDRILGRGHDHDSLMAETPAVGVRENPELVVGKTLFVDWLQQHSHHATLPN